MSPNQGNTAISCPPQINAQIKSTKIRGKYRTISEIDGEFVIE